MGIKELIWKRLIVSTLSSQHEAGKNNPYKRYLRLESPLGGLPWVALSMWRCFPVAHSDPPKTVPSTSPEKNIPALIISWRAAAKLPLGHTLFSCLLGSNPIGASLLFTEQALFSQLLISTHTLLLGQVELFSATYSQATSKQSKNPTGIRKWNTELNF